MIIKLGGGLCNYLRTLFSYYSYCEKNNEKLIVVWISTGECPGLFCDYFEPIENVLFEYADNQIYNYYYIGGSIHPSCPPDYKKLKLLEKIEIIIKNKIELLGKYIAVHIRRTDHVVLAKKYNQYTSDEDFINFIDKEKEGKNLYIASDNEDTYNLFKEKYSHLIKFEYHNQTKDCLRKTNLEDAIIDLYMCVYADKFMGSGYSSFSDLINCLRN